MATHDAPEPRLLIIGTGGTICMRESPDGLVPAKGFLDEGMAPRPSFNDGEPAVNVDAVSEHGGESVAADNRRQRLEARA